jgi:uncharacterized repeat protein (TIGR01451 family)
MSLNDLQDRIYKPDSEASSRQHEESEFDPNVSSEADSSILQKEKEWAEKPVGLRWYQKKALRIGGLIVGGMILTGIVILSVYKIQKSAFIEENVTLEFKGPISVGSNQPMRYTLSYRNNNRVSLKNAQLVLNYSENFKPEEKNGLKIENLYNSNIQLGEIAPYSGGEVELAGTFYAPDESIVYLNAKLNYTPKNIESVFQKERQLGVEIKSSPLLLELETPFEVANGDRLEYLISYQNTSNQIFENIRIKADYAQGFAFDSADPAPSEGNGTWYLGTLNPGQSGKISIRGNLSGMKGDAQILKVSIGSFGDGNFVVYSNREKVTRIVGSALTISQSVGSFRNVNAGETIPYTIKYKNIGEVGMRNVIITLQIDSKIVDVSKLKLKKGYFNGANNTIIWKAPDYLELANLGPGQEGKIEFSMKLLDFIPVNSENDKNFTLKTVAKIDSPDIPTPIGANKIISSSELSLKLNSKIIFEVKGFYNDPNIPNAGPIPPKVGSETSYTIHWKVSNLFNNITDTKVSSFLPTGVKWTGKTYPEGENVKFNERTNQLTWDVGSISNGTGVITPAKEVSFQVSVIPQVNQVGTAVEILKPSALVAKDSFTDQEVKINVKEKTTTLSEDTAMDRFGYRVVQ